MNSFLLSSFNACLFVLGPAFYAYNDAIFTPEDWHGIQEIARSRKKDDPLKVGRFGIGFNSVYHITGTFSRYFHFKILPLKIFKLRIRQGCSTVCTVCFK